MFLQLYRGHHFATKIRKPEPQSAKYWIANYNKFYYSFIFFVICEQIEYNIQYERDIVILGIESSCDDTSAAVIKRYSSVERDCQSESHEEYGGVVPELASRAHQQNIIP